MPKVLLLVFPGFSEFEIAVAMAIIRGRFQVDSVGLSAAPVVSEAGLRVIPHASVSDIDAASYEALIIPGAEDLSPVLDVSSIQQLIRTLHDRGTLVAAICGGPILLAKAGILAGRPYTVGLYRQFRDFLGCFDEAWFRYQPMVESDNVLTAQGFAFVEFGLRIGERLGAMRNPDAVRAYYRGQGDINWEDDTDLPEGNQGLR